MVSDVLKDRIKWTTVPSSSESVLEHEGTTIVRSVWTYTSSDTLSHSEDWNLNLNYYPINSGFFYFCVHPSYSPFIKDVLC